MKHIHTTATMINKIKREARTIKKELGIQLAEALELASVKNGYKSYFHATTCFKNSENIKQPFDLSQLKPFYYHDENKFVLRIDDMDSLYNTVEEFDQFLDELRIGVNGFSDLNTYELQSLITKCKKLTTAQPAFLDGYSHWVGALLTLDREQDALSLAEPIVDKIFEIIKQVPKGYKPSYYDLDNRPFYRLAHGLVLTYFKTKQKPKGITLAKKMLQLHPNDNIGFRFLISGDDEG